MSKIQIIFKQENKKNSKKNFSRMWKIHQIKIILIEKNKIKIKEMWSIVHLYTIIFSILKFLSFEKKKMKQECYYLVRIII